MRLSGGAKSRNTACLRHCLWLHRSSFSVLRRLRLEEALRRRRPVELPPRPHKAAAALEWPLPVLRRPWISPDIGFRSSRKTGLNACPPIHPHPALDAVVGEVAEVPLLLLPPGAPLPPLPPNVAASTGPPAVSACRAV